LRVEQQLNLCGRAEPSWQAHRWLTVGEWVREVVLKTSEPQPASAAEQTLLSEVLALRAILINTVYDLASGGWDDAGADERADR
jgi:hypothetical protein